MVEPPESEDKTMLREEIEQYTKLTGEDGWHVPIVKVGAYLDGYNKGLEALDKVRAEIEQNAYPIVHGCNNHELGMTLYGIIQVIDEYKAESEAEE